ncbi:hypothetical protein CF326_g9316 [Tilletia indica]|nr:hypothetical protein CF326_g9316 [Tilletia indica]
MTDFTLSPSKYRQDQEGQYSGCPGLQAKRPTKFTFPRMHKIPIAHTQSIKYSCIHPGTCNTTYKVDTGPYTRQYGNNGTAGNPSNAASAPRQQNIVLMLVLCSVFTVRQGPSPPFLLASQATSTGHPLHIRTKWTHTLRSADRNEDTQETLKAYTYPRSQRTTITWLPYVVNIQPHTTHPKSQWPKNAHTHP